MQAVILSIGDELVLGQSLDTNSAYLSAQLAARGIGTLYHQTVADDQPAIVDAIKHASERVSIVLMTGGLGPTEDDLTRQALADAMAVDLVTDEESIKAIRTFFDKRGRDMPERNAVQAKHPKGSVMIANSAGTAPGISAKVGKALFYIMPGPPLEMEAMWKKSVLPEIKKLAPQRKFILTKKINTFGVGESTIADQLGDLMDRARNPKVGTTAGGGLVGVRLRSEFEDTETAERELDKTVSLVHEKLGAIIFSEDDRTLQEAAVTNLRDARKTLATAESCTGGMIGAMITETAGASDVFKGGWVTYANEMKVNQLGVNPIVVKQHGAVSEQVAKAMAQGTRERSGADVAVSVTGIAGPGGGTENKPVGTVWIGLADGDKAQAVLLHLSGTRDGIRLRAAQSALQIVRYHLMGLKIDEAPFIVKPELVKND